MNVRWIRNAALSMSMVSVLGLGCGQGAMSDEDAEVGEAASYLTAADETGDLGNESLAAETPAEYEELAGDASVPVEASEEAGVCDFGARRRKVLAHYDANGNGRLDPSERRQLRADLEAKVGHPLAVRFAIRHRLHVLKRLKWVFDENNDGVLSKDERTAMVDAMEARCERIRAAVLEKFDADKNGVLDETEKAAAKAAFKARLAAIRQAVLDKYDVNKNGVLDESERLALRADLIAQFQAKKQALIARFDADGDGRLNQAELLALKKAIQQRIIEGKDAE